MLILVIKSKFNVYKIITQLMVLYRVRDTCTAQNFDQLCLRRVRLYLFHSRTRLR
jgi:hypothetical protein